MTREEIINRLRQEFKFATHYIIDNSHAEYICSMKYNKKNVNIFITNKNQLIYDNVSDDFFHSIDEYINHIKKNLSTYFGRIYYKSLFEERVFVTVTFEHIVVDSMSNFKNCTKVLKQYLPEITQKISEIYNNVSYGKTEMRIQGTEEPDRKKYIIIAFTGDLK